MLIHSLCHLKMHIVFIFISRTVPIKLQSISCFQQINTQSGYVLILNFFKHLNSYTQQFKFILIFLNIRKLINPGSDVLFQLMIRQKYFNQIEIKLYNLFFKISLNFILKMEIENGNQNIWVMPCFGSVFFKIFLRYNKKL